MKGRSGFNFVNSAATWSSTLLFDWFRCSTESETRTVKKSVAGITDQQAVVVYYSATTLLTEPLMVLSYGVLC